ncbi:alpha/beta hydrolase [Nonomuraea sp. NPDC050536]|uniref:alpha/beta hydrolase n=1 Tax=Nonomuraea sp. NPDC050536 TaxID=3364366 RepID=UPI0037CC1836
MRKIVGLACVALALTACGGTVREKAAPPSSSPPSVAASSAAPTEAPTEVVTGPNVSGCFTEKDGKIFSYGDDLPGVITGKGSVGVVISYERGGNVCTWRPLSDRLVAAGYRVLLYARATSAYPEDATVAMAKRLAKEKGVKKLFLVGGSIGATTAVPAAEKFGQAKVAGVVALSGEIDAADAAKLTVPLLQVGSENDSYGGATSLQAAHDAAAKAPDDQLLVIKGGTMHASELFPSPDGPKVLDTIVAFMNRHKG